jgi:hypothetical protein
MKGIPMTREKQTDVQRRAANLARQMRYRERHLQRGADGTAPLARVNCLVNAAAKDSLDRLAQTYGITMKATIERLVSDAESAIIASRIHLAEIEAVCGARDARQARHPWPAHIREMAVRMKAEGAKLPDIAQAMATAGGRAAPDTSSLTRQIRTWATKLSAA